MKYPWSIREVSMKEGCCDDEILPSSEWQWWVMMRFFLRQNDSGDEILSLSEWQWWWDSSCVRMTGFGGAPWFFLVKSGVLSGGFCDLEGGKPPRYFPGGKVTPLRRRGIFCVVFWGDRVVDLGGHFWIKRNFLVFFGYFLRFSEVRFFFGKKSRIRYECLF